MATTYEPRPVDGFDARRNFHVYDCRLIAEWEPQAAILLAWPHKATDWAPRLPQITRCYRDIVFALTAHNENVVIIAPHPEDVGDVAWLPNVTVVPLPTNDTWTRDYGPICLAINSPTDLSFHVRLLDFTFNAWGMKFAADCDNLVSQRLALETTLFDETPIENHRDFVLEGGAIETDGEGTLLTTVSCMLSPNRNAQYTDEEQINEQLKFRLGVKKVLWLHHGYLPGDDTDGHIDTLARFTPDGHILHATARPCDPHYDEMQAMAAELAQLFGPERLVPLPAPALPTDDNGTFLPATYANYLVANQCVLVPTYGQPETDRQAIRTIARSFPKRDTIGVDCQELIRQHGSLHCATLQLHLGTVNTSMLL